MADRYRYIRKYLREKGKKGKNELTSEDINNSDFGSWLASCLQHGIYD